jgi:hypothetical protein
MRTQQTHGSAAGSAIALALITGMTAAAPVSATPHPQSASTTHVVWPGQSIQRAVNGANPGDTVLIRPGIYHESVQVTVSDLTIRGAGRKTVIRPGAEAADAASDSPARTDKTSDSPARRAAVQAANACATAGNGICVTGTAQREVSGVHISSLVVSGFRKNGIWGYETDRMSVRQVLSENNGQQGLGQEKSTRGEFIGNTSRNNAESGVFLANTVTEEGAATETQGTIVRGNLLYGNRIGVVIRRLRDLTVERNDITANCGGVFLVGDEGTPRGGHLSVRGNRVTANNRYCPATARLPFIQGAGIVLTGVEKTLVTGNKVLNNVGASPMSGGIVLFASAVGTPNSRNLITRNTALGNEPADLVNRDPKGTGNIFTANRCRTSEPAGRCRKVAR